MAANPYGLSAQDIQDLQQIAQHLPAGDPRVNKVNLLLNSAPTQFEQERDPANHRGVVASAWDTLKQIPAGIVHGIAQGGEMAQAEPIPGVPNQPIEETLTGQSMQADMEADARRKAQGRSAAYRAIAPVGESVGADVKGMEDAAEVGNARGVVGHAVGSAIPVVAGEAVKVISPEAVRAAAGKAGPAIRSGVTTVADVGAAVLDNDVAGSFSPRAAHIGKILGKMADALRKGKQVAPEDIGPMPEEGSYPVTTPSDVPLEQMPAEPTTAIEKELAYFAEKGDVKAQAALEQIQAQKPKIRASAEAARSKNTPADRLDDKMAAEAARADLESHGRAAYAEQRREFADRNSMDTPKWRRLAEHKAADVLEQAQQQVAQILEEAEKQAKTPKKFTETKPLKAMTPDDVTSLLEQSIAAAKAKKNAQ